MNAKAVAALVLGPLLGVIVATGASLQVFVLLGYVAVPARIDVFVTGLAIGGVAYLAHMAIREVRDARQRAAEKIWEAESSLAKERGRVKPAWDLARVTLEAYFTRNLSQITYIFALSVVVMLAGFGIIIWGIYRAILLPDKLAPAAIAGVAGVITEFIGATFLFIYRSTIQQAMNYSKTLERINSAGMAMQILDTMPDETKPEDLKNKTKAVLVELLVRQAHQARETTEDSTK